MSVRQRALLLGVLVAVVGVVVFVPAVRGSWIYDDHILIPDNPYAHSFEWWPRWWGKRTRCWPICAKPSAQARRILLAG